LLHAKEWRYLLTLAIQILLLLLLITGVAVGARLFVVLGDVRRTLSNVETTRAEIDATLKRLETVAASTEKVLVEEVAPTLQVARATLANVERATNAIAETTLVVRGIAAKVEGLTSATKLIGAGAPLMQAVAQKAATAVSGMVGGVVGLFRRRKKPKSRVLTVRPAPAVAELRDETQTVALPSGNNNTAVMATTSQRRR
jgi:hypothetical protein